MSEMFRNATSFNQDVSGWEVSAVTDMGDMFFGATAFDRNLGPWYIAPDTAAFNAAGASLNVTMAERWPPRTQSWTTTTPPTA